MRIAFQNFIFYLVKKSVNRLWTWNHCQGVFKLPTSQVWRSWSLELSVVATGLKSHPESKVPIQETIWATSSKLHYPTPLFIGHFFSGQAKSKSKSSKFMHLLQMTSSKFEIKTNIQRTFSKLIPFLQLWLILLTRRSWLRFEDWRFGVIQSTWTACVQKAWFWFSGIVQKRDKCDIVELKVELGGSLEIGPFYVGSPLGKVPLPCAVWWILKDICTTTVYGAATYRSKGQICCKAAVFAKFQCNVDSAAAVKDFHRFLSISDSVIFLIAGLGMDFLTRVPDFPIWFLAFLERTLEHSSPHDQSDQQSQH